MDYIILQAESKDRWDAARSLQEDVKSKMQNGYEPQGGISVSISKHGYEDWYLFSQAMIKK